MLYYLFYADNDDNGADTEDDSRQKYTENEVTIISTYMLNVG